MEVIKVAIADDHKIFRKGVVLSMRPYTNIKFVMDAERTYYLMHHKLPIIAELIAVAVAPASNKVSELALTI